MTYSYSYYLIGLVLFVVLLAGGALLHRLNLVRTYNRLLSVSGGVSKEKVEEALFTPQGSNFNAAVISAWMLLFVALAYFYFLTPRVFPDLNYFLVADLASGPLGLFIFGLVVMLVVGSVGVVSLRLMKFYGFYGMSRGMKAVIMLTVPVLMVSISFSVYLGTLYPAGDATGLKAAVLATLLFSQIVLLLPVYIDTWEAVR
ncbi:MAG: hypothetical protein D4Q77_01700 [Methanothrix sp.]|nr:MAG: hypothetical protein D4Q77_01700 [Methanothrix sp.]